VNILSYYWTEVKIKEVIKSVREAGRWLEREADRYSVNLRVSVADNLFLIKSGSFPSAHNDARERVYDWASRMLQKGGYEDIQHYVHTLQMAEKADNWATLFHVKASGRSYAFPAVENNPIEFVVCFAEYYEYPNKLFNRNWRPDSRLYAHEILHLFDAKDKYETPSKFPASDIMNEMYKFPLDILRITEATARELGWAGAAPRF
jgi:hypothetical protein